MSRPAAKKMNYDEARLRVLMGECVRGKSKRPVADQGEKQKKERKPSNAKKKKKKAKKQEIFVPIPSMVKRRTHSFRWCSIPKANIPQAKKSDSRRLSCKSLLLKRKEWQRAFCVVSTAKKKKSEIK